MRIAFYAPMKPPDHPVPSGDRRMARLLMQALATAGHEVVLASRLRSWDDGTRPGRQARIAWLGGRLAARLVRRWTERPAERPHLWFTYHLYHKAPDWLGPPVTRALGLPYVVAEASHSRRQADGPWAAGHAASVAAIKAARAIFTFSEVDQAGLRALVAPPRIVRVKPFLDTTPFRSALADRPAERARWFGSDPGPWLLAVGMMRAGDKQRSYELLAKAVRRLEGPWRLAIVGDGPARAPILAAFEPGRALWLGQRPAEDLPGLYAAADLMVWPAVNEAYGMALLEAMAAGLPIVAGCTGGVPEIVRHGVSGLLTPPGDAEAFAGAVQDLLDDEKLRRAFGREAAGLAEAEHDLANAARLLDGRLRSLAS